MFHPSSRCLLSRRVSIPAAYGKGTPTGRIPAHHRDTLRKTPVYPGIGALSLPPETEPYREPMVFHCKVCDPSLTWTRANTVFHQCRSPTWPICSEKPNCAVTSFSSRYGKGRFLYARGKAPCLWRARFKLSVHNDFVSTIIFYSDHNKVSESVTFNSKQRDQVLWPFRAQSLKPYITHCGVFARRSCYST